MITINEHKSSSYAPRTYLNAASADITLAIAADFSTAGEKLTKKAAADKYIHFSMNENPLVCARKLYKFMKDRGATSINVAGNGIYTMTKFGYSQKDCNKFLLDVLSPIHEHLGITKLVSGMQTGMDLSAAVVAEILGIDFVGTLPNGFKQRHESGLDVSHTQQEILEQIHYFSSKLINP